MNDSKTTKAARSQRQSFWFNHLNLGEKFEISEPSESRRNRRFPKAMLSIGLIAGCLIAPNSIAFADDDRTSSDSVTATSGSTPSDSDTSVAVTSQLPASAQPNILKGKAEITSINKDRSLRAWQAGQLYAQGAAALDNRNYSLAADLFRRAGDAYDLPGLEKFEAQARFAEAQVRKAMGQKQEAARRFQQSIDLFNEYDPLSGYLKAALDNLKVVQPNLKGVVNRDLARMEALKNPDRIMRVDRNVVLKSGLSEYGSSALLAQKATADIPQKYVHDTIHKAFVRMTCLETADLGSNYITAENRWYTLLANGKDVTVPASSNFMVPMVQAKINERKYNIPVDLPDLGPNKRTVFLLTDGCHIVAIDPSTEDMWNLIGDFTQPDAKFTWKKLIHFKAKRKN